MTPSAPDADQDALYTRVAAEFGPPLARLAGAYESDSSRRQDLLQELHFAVWRSLATFRNQCSLRYLGLSGSTQLGNDLAYASSEEVGAFVSQVSKISTNQFRGTMSNVWSMRRIYVERSIKDLIEQLKPVDRDVLLLCLEGLKAAEIAEVVGISPGNVAQKVHRAQKYLKAHFHSGESHERDQ